MGLLAPAALAQSTAPFADAARALAGDGAARIVALGAAISCFGALNGWMLIVGQLPLAVARTASFPGVRTPVSPRGTPATGDDRRRLLATALVAMNYSRGLVELFTFIILLSTLSTLVPTPSARSPVSSLAAGSGEADAGRGDRAALAFVYSIWAIGGAGAEVVFWGFLLLICGLPVYVWVARTARERAPSPSGAVRKKGSGRGTGFSRSGPPASAGQPSGRIPASSAGCCTNPCARRPAFRIRRRCAPAGGVGSSSRTASPTESWFSPSNEAGGNFSGNQHPGRPPAGLSF